MLAIRSSGRIQNLGIHWQMSITPRFTTVTLTMDCPVREIRQKQKHQLSAFVLL